MEMPKFLQKAREFMFPSHDPEENQATAINQAAKKEAGIELPEKPEPAKVNQAEEGMKAARENLADKGKSPIEEGKGKETFEKADKEIAPRHESVGIAPKMHEEKPKEAEPEKPTEPVEDNSEKEVDEEVGNDKEVSAAIESKDPVEAKEALINYLTKKGLVKISDNGTIDFGRLKQTKGSIFSRIGTVASMLLAVATGGAIPPINFYKLSGMEDEDKKRQELYQNLMDNLAETAGQVGSIKEKAAQSPDIAEKAGEFEYKQSGAYAKDMQSLKNTIETMRESNANAKDYAQAMIEMNARSPQALRDYLTESGLSKDEYINLKNILDKGYWTTAELQKWGQRLENIGKGVGAGTGVAGTALKAAGI